MLRPAFRQVLSDQEVNEGQTVRLEFTRSGRPTPEIVWYLGEARLKQDANHKVRCVCSSTQCQLHCVVVVSTSSTRACFQMVVNEEGVHSLLILHAEPSDAGAYTCLALNPAGEATFSVTLRVTPRSRSEPPRFFEKPVSIIVPEGEPASFVCRAAGTPASAFSWLADGHPLDA